MRLSYRYRVYPLRVQDFLLDFHRTELAALWNHALAQRGDAWSKEGRSLSYLEQQGDLTRGRNYDTEGLGRISVHVAQDCLQRLDLAFRAFFRRVRSGERPGYPRYRRSVDSFTFTPEGNPIVPGPSRTWRVKVPRVGEVPIRLHRPLPEDAEIRTVTLRYQAGDWYATLALELPDPTPPPPTLPANPVGVDLGIRSLVTLSTGEKIDTPRFFLAQERRLARAQRQLARKHKGSHRYQKQKERVVRCHAKVRRQRSWFLHQVSHDLAERFDLVAFEDLDAAKLAAGNPLAKSILNAGWGRLRSMTAYKEQLRRGRCMEVPSEGTSQTCSACGKVAVPPLTLGERVYRCGSCGRESDRDHNAAENVLGRGLALLTQELRESVPEVTRGESGPPPVRVGRRVYQSRRVRARSREGRIGLRVTFPTPKFVFRKLPRSIR